MNDIIDFSRFRIIGADGNVYRGVRPSLVPKPFRQISYKTPSGQLLFPKTNPQKPDSLILGYDGSFRIVNAQFNHSTLYVRLVTYYKDDTAWGVLFERSGTWVQEGQTI